MKIYTRTGDRGQTSLFGGGRVGKDHPRVTAYGSVDELNSFLGLALVRVTYPPTRKRLERLQHDLFVLGSVLATPAAGEGRRRPETPVLPEERIEEMERWIDEADERLPPLRHFILPGGSEGAATLHVARTVCRRAERTVTPLVEGGEVEPGVLRYLNRLSDLLFALARLENQAVGKEDVAWEKG